MRAFLITEYERSPHETLRLVEDVPESAFNTIVNGKSPAWLVGHLAAGSEFICMLCGGTTAMGDLMPLFAPGSEPDASAGYPSKAGLIALLEGRHAEAVRSFNATPDDAFDQPLPMDEYREFFPKLGNAVTYLMASHEPYHNGQLQQWRLAVGVG